ncbi:MAG: glycoside hydrolase family 27 protein [Kiritimatiellae bacterium]|nr:glycoside hydrolase family 27 protein [Kiritimatiellia bacterium]
MGWNSYDCHGSYLDEIQALANLDVFARRLLPSGYEYFCIDYGWFLDQSYLEQLTLKPEAIVYNIDACGRFVASPRRFPDGLARLARACHAAGAKFGVHLMRGIPRVAVERNTPVLGTPYHAADIVDKANSCEWGPACYGVDMAKPGAQAYYDSVVSAFDEWGVDFVKVDDMVDHPAEMQAFAKAVEKAGRPMLISLSPGDNAFTGNMALYRRCGDMLRISGDIWDRSKDLLSGFERWELWQELGGSACWLDLDMIPFGALQVYVPEYIDPKYYAPHGLGVNRQSRFTHAQKQTFITQRALAASPLFFGGELTKTPDVDFNLVTHPEVLACARNGVMGRRIFAARHIDVRRCEERKNPGHGWIGVFDRKCAGREIAVTLAELGFADTAPVRLFDIWNEVEIAGGKTGIRIKLEAEGVAFLRF